MQQPPKVIIPDDTASADPDNVPPRSRLFLVVPKTAEARVVHVSISKLLLLARLLQLLQQQGPVCLLDMAVCLRQVESSTLKQLKCAQHHVSHGGQPTAVEHAAQQVGVSDAMGSGVRMGRFACGSSVFLQQQL